MTPCQAIREYAAELARGGRKAPRPEGAHAQTPGTAHADKAENLVKWLSSAVVVASVVHLLHPFLLPFELQAFALASNFSVFKNSLDTEKVASATGQLAVVAIDEQRFEARYKETTPLDRCQLASDLRMLSVNLDLLTVAIDLDLSPIARDRGAAVDCQARLNDVVDSLGQRAILIAPFRKNDTTSKWQEDRKHAKVSFGSADLKSRFGMVTRYFPPECPDRHFAELVADRLCAASIGPTTAYCTAVAAGAHVGGGHEPSPVIFHAINRLHGTGTPLNFDDACLRSSATQAVCPAGPVRHVIVGGTYITGGGSDDNFLTPIGRLNGVMVHAAIAAKPRHDTPKWISFVIDVVIGVGFAWFLHLIWPRYFDQMASLPDAKRPRSQQPYAAYLWLILLVVGLVATACVLAFVGVMLFAHRGWWISPVPMLIGMCIDAFVLDGVRVAQERLAPSASMTDKPSIDRLGRMLERLPCASALVLVVAVVNSLWH